MDPDGRGAASSGRSPSRAGAAASHSPAPAAWSLQVSATAGIALEAADPAGRPLFRIACRRNPPDLFVLAPGLRRIGSEERLTLGAGDALAALVVDPAVPAGDPVAASGAVAPDLVEALAGGAPVGLSYGAAAVGPVAPPPPRMRRGFADACRGA